MASPSAAPPRFPVSLVVLARNEEEQIQGCLESVVGWVDEVIVVDMESTDATSDIARRMGAIVISHPRIGNFDRARTPGILAARNDWILVLDADEEPTPGLLQVLSNLIGDGSTDALLLPRANLNLSGWAPHSEKFPEYTLRMFRKSKMDIEGFDGRIHRFYRPVEGARIQQVPGSYPSRCLLHFTNPALGPLWAKTDLYTTEEARQRWSAGTTRPHPWDLVRPLRVFLRRYLLHGGWRDGWHGFWLAWAGAVYQALIVAKIWEMSLHDGKLPDAPMARLRMRRIVSGSD